jgi:hypothetical protein
MRKVKDRQKHKAGPYAPQSKGAFEAAKRDAVSSGEIAMSPIAIMKEKLSDKMNATAVGIISETPSGEMPRGRMATAGGGTLGELPTGAMPSGVMTSSGATIVGQRPTDEMPRGEMIGSANMGDVRTIEIPGLWRLTLSPASP